jgi:hypothetical protein
MSELDYTLLNNPTELLERLATAEAQLSEIKRIAEYPPIDREILAILESGNE